MYLTSQFNFQITLGLIKSNGFVHKKLNLKRTTSKNVFLGHLGE